MGDVRPSSAPGEYCSAHMGMAVMGIERDLLVNAWYTGGANVIDFSQPTQAEGDRLLRPGVELGHVVRVPVRRPDVRDRHGIPVYATDGVTNNGLAQGMVVYRTTIERPGRRGTVDHLNPQTMD